MTENPHNFIYVHTDLCWMSLEYHRRMADCFLHRCCYQRVRSGSLHPAWARKRADLGCPHTLLSWRLRKKTHNLDMAWLMANSSKRCCAYLKFYNYWKEEWWFWLRLSILEARFIWREVIYYKETESVYVTGSTFKRQLRNLDWRVGYLHFFFSNATLE